MILTADWLTPKFLTICLRRTVLVTVLATVYIHAAAGEIAALLFFSGVAFMTGIILTLLGIGWNLIQKKRSALAVFFLALHLVLLYAMIPFYGTVLAGLPVGNSTGHVLSLLAGLNLFFIIAFLRAMGEQLFASKKETEEAKVKTSHC